MLLPQPKTPFLDSLDKYRDVPACDNPAFSTGIPLLDTIFNGKGMEAGLYLIASDPGCGKSTLCLQLLHHYYLAGHMAIYGAYEGKRNIHTIMKRLSLPRGIVVVDQLDAGWEPETATIVKRMYQHSAENYTGKPLVLCLDSIKNLGTGSNEARKAAVKELHEACTHTNTILLVIAHATKDSIGKKNKRLEGPSELLGQADCLMYLVGGEPKDGVRPVTVDTSGKNRLGEPGVFPGLTLSRTGFQWPGKAISASEAMDVQVAEALALAEKLLGEKR